MASSNVAALEGPAAEGRPASRVLTFAFKRHGSTVVALYVHVPSKENRGYSELSPQLIGR